MSASDATSSGQKEDLEKLTVTPEPVDDRNPGRLHTFSYTVLSYSLAGTTGRGLATSHTPLQDISNLSRGNG